MEIVQVKYQLQGIKDNYKYLSLFLILHTHTRAHTHTHTHNTCPPIILNNIFYESMKGFMQHVTYVCSKKENVQENVFMIDGIFQEKM